MFWLERAALVDSEVVGLTFGQAREFDPDFLEVESSDLFVETFWEDVDGGFVEVSIFPEIELSEDLIGEAVGHHEAWVSGGATEVHEATFCEHEDFVTIWEAVFVHLRFDVGALDAGFAVEEVHLDLVIEVADVAHDGLIFHAFHVRESDDVDVAGGGDVDVGTTEGVFDGGDFETFHGGLESVDGVDFGDDDAGALATKGLCAAFPDVAVSADDGDFTGDHDIDGAVETVDEGVSAAVEVVELGFGDGVVDVEGRDEEFSLFLEFIEAVDTGGGFLGDAAPSFDDGVPVDGIFAVDIFEEVFDDRLFGAFGG